MAEETVILHFEVDQGAAEKRLEKIEKLLLDNKAAQQELSKAYKAGTITQEEYVKENIRLQQNTKKEQEQKKTLIKTLDTESNSRNSLRQRISELTKQYDNVNLKSKEGENRAKALSKEISKLNEQLTKGDKAAGLFKNQIGNYPQQFANAAKGISLAGVSVGDITTKFASFLNPATAVAGVIAGLVGAYAASTIGAKDLQQATDTLSSGFSIASNNYAEFVQKLSNSSKKEGPLEQASRAINQLLFGTGVANQADALANALEILRQLEISSAFAKGFAKDAEVSAEKARRIRDDDTKTLIERLEQTKRIEDELNKSGQIRTIILGEQVKQIKFATDRYEDNRDAQLRVAGIESEIKDINEEITGKLTENVTARQKILKLIQDQRILEEFNRREANKPTRKLNDPLIGDPNATTSNLLDNTVKFDFASGIDDPAIEASKARQTQFISELKTVQQTEDQKRQAAKQTSDFRKAEDQAQLQSAEIVFNALSGLAKEGSAEQRALALVAIGLDTAQALTGGIAAAQDVPYPGNLVAMASVIATILANVAAAKQYIEGFKEGGFTGPGRDNQAAGIVHANEYVTPAHVVRSPAAQPHLHALESMRMRGYQDGGFVTNQSTAPVQQALIMANALKNLPRPVVDVRQVTAAQQQIEVKQAVSTLGR